MKTVLAVIGGIVVLLALLLFAVCNDDEGDSNSYGPLQLASHRYDEQPRCYDEDCDGGGDQNYEDQWSNEDRNRNRNRNRGAFSPGPFDDSPVDAFNGNVVCLPGSTCYSDDRRRGDEPPPE